tara:strand:+ start:10825 stop:11409 length:585 start_codon:yes stop_codon:yes gene_type:complete
MATKTVDEYIENQSNWNKELLILRDILSSINLEESIKWGAPTYSYKGQNIVGIAAFKNYFGLWFFQGALINDTHKVLINAQEEKTKAMRQLRFNSVDEVDAKIIINYVTQAMKMVDDGVKIMPEKKALEIPIMLEKMLENLPDLAKNFNAMGLTKQREFCDYINEAKQQATKERRLDKVLEHIENNKGLNEKYR